MRECSVCNRLFDDGFSVFAPPCQEAFDRIECARRAAAVWAADERLAPILLPTVEALRPHSEPLARAVQSRMIATLPLEDQGVYYRSLAVVRTSWMPAVLIEGGFIIVPEQESAMRTPWYQERYARAVADGLEQYFRSIRAP